MGFRFTSTNRLGYRLNEIPNIILQPLLHQCLSSSIQLGRIVKYFSEIDSTNKTALELADQDCPHGTLVVANKQTGGKGRRGRSWYSPDSGIWMSIILQRRFSLQRAAELTLLTSIAVRRAIQSITGLPIQIKWPNDLLMNGRKICGILAEIRADGETVHHAVVGIGINANAPTEDFPESLREVATSIYAESGQSLNKCKLTAQILYEFEPLYEQLISGKSSFAKLLPEWKSASDTLGKMIKVLTPRHTYEGIALDIDELGVLYLQLKSGEVVQIHSGDVLF